MLLAMVFSLTLVQKKKKSQVAMTETGPQAQSSPSSCYVRVLGTTDTLEGVGGSEEL